MTKFRELPIGATFDWVNDDPKCHSNTFYHRCEKTSARGYRTLTGAPMKLTVGTLNATVYHVGKTT